MVLIFGGVYQGKLDFAINKFKVSKNNIYNMYVSKNNMNELVDYAIKNNEIKIINGFEELIYKLVVDNINPIEFITKNLNYLSNKIIIVSDISQGIVPMDKIDRRWREEVGRTLFILGKNSDAVYRIFCGLDTRLK